jgi:uncharacterized PurR-regulated membrane protein YhhQ (DUF165 family)
MRTDNLEDPWLLPTHQVDYPSREQLPESRMHGRREGTFLVLVGLFLLGSIAMPAFGTARTIDLGAALTRMIPGFEPPVALQIPLGALLFPLALIAVQLVSELYGRRRASAMVWVGLFATLSITGLMRAVDVLGGDGTGFTSALAFSACYLVGQFINLSSFDVMRRKRGDGRRLWLHVMVAVSLALIFGWAAFAGVMYAVLAQTGTVNDLTLTLLTALAVGSFAYTAVIGLVLVLPAALIARGLAVFLRVGIQPLEIEALPPRRMAEGSTASQARPVAPPAPPAPTASRVGVSERRQLKKSVQPFNSAEMRFFTEGDELANPAD